MKQMFAVLPLLAALAITRVGAQDPATAAAEREQAEERVRSMSKTMERLEEGFAALQKNVSALREEVRQLKDELDRFKSKNEGAATQDNIKRLAEKIEEVDRKRQADNEKTVKYIDARNAELQKMLLEKPSGSSHSNVTPPAATGNERPRNSSPPPPRV